LVGLDIFISGASGDQIRPDAWNDALVMEFYTQ
jgi:hypothetical protein